MRRSGATARRGSPSMAAGKGGGYRGRVGWRVARPIVRRGLVGVSGKRRARGWGFDAGQAFGERLFGSVSGQSTSIVGFTVMAPSCHRIALAVAERRTGPGGAADVRRLAAQAGSKAASTSALPDWLLTHPTQSRPTGFSEAAVRWGRCLLGCASTKRPSVTTARRPSAGFGSRCATARGRPNSAISACAWNVDSRRNQSINIAYPE